jgi:hypothetical protein
MPAQADVDHCCLRLLVAVACSKRPFRFRPLIALNAPLLLAVTVDSRVGAPVPYLSWTDTGARADFVL